MYAVFTPGTSRRASTALLAPGNSASKSTLAWRCPDENSIILETIPSIMPLVTTRITITGIRLKAMLTMEMSIFGRVFSFFRRLGKKRRRP